jgi:hypothetical protein
MQVKLELTANCSDIEQMLQDKHGMSGDVRLTGVEFDETGDLVAFEIEVAAEDSMLIGRSWDNYAFTEGLLEEAI